MASLARCAAATSGVERSGVVVAGVDVALFVPVVLVVPVDLFVDDEGSGRLLEGSGRLLDGSGRLLEEPPTRDIAFILVLHCSNK